ncbi:excinuclease ABC subunit UvrA [Clostridium sp. ATCC 25772]|uniref:excinuclease ABC subunit UvrA n=1 Tax=Clostridium sp. ATCC 25772 TaxID=1676991 RepID=UPI000783A8E7|nr:excinuclease ABC subunit UvrA [Clostridium sp. ATCC 25772]
MNNIQVLCAKENNLKNINVTIPLNKITVVTGVSGSGKSSLVFDTIYAESERMFLESMSMNISMLTSSLKKPDVYKINNLIPAIAISQKQTNRNPRSTVGTVTDISQFIRLLFSRIANIDTNLSWTEGDFSYNNIGSWCNKCKGTGEEYSINEEKIIDFNKSINDGAIIYWNETNKDYYNKLLNEVAKYYEIDLDVELNKLDANKLEFLLYGESDVKFTIRYKNYKGNYRNKSVKFVGIYKELNNKLIDIETPSTLKGIQKFLIRTRCTKCNGSRLKEDRLEVELYGKNIYDIHKMPITELKVWMKDNVKSDGDIRDKIFLEIANEVEKRIENLEKVKLGYLSLYRSVPTLSGGEIQRLRLANQLSCGLSGLLYVLDEPTMGLHMNDIKNISNILNDLKAKGNTILLVEHNAEIMLKSDYIIDMGPKGGINGGEIIFKGTPKEIIKKLELSTGEYLKYYNKDIQYNQINDKNNKFLNIIEATSNNVILQDFKIPLNKFVVITGGSGSGKSTIINNIIEPSLNKRKVVNCKAMEGKEYIDKVIKVDQSPIGRSPKSNIATYTGMFDLIRDIFSKTVDAKKNKVTKSNFSFNVEGGRCEKCKGDGNIKVDMSFMPDTYIECDECKGRRYKEKVLDIKYNGKNIYEVLSMSVIEAYDFFSENKKISQILQCLIDVGLEYIGIGQSALTISGGEAQRIKLAKYLSDEPKNNIMYILDEPSVGLHYSDVKKLIELLKKMVARGNSIVIVEHNSEIIRNSEYILDMGLDGGPLGGKVIDMGSPLQVKLNGKASVTNIL